MLAAALLATLAALPFAADPHAPVLVHDRDERSPATFAPAPGEGPRPTAYRHVTAARDGGSWRQYWLFYADNPHDRGIVRTGRHEGDWEMVQLRLDARGDPVEMVLAQHSVAERCGWPEVRRRGGHPVVFVANGSHASYLRPGTRDRGWPDPNDEADGRGRVIRPVIRPVTATRPAWMAWRGRWGASRAGLVPGEQDSPRGPAHQPRSWDPERLAGRARPCRAGCDRAGECDGRETAAAAGGAGVLGLLALAGVARRRRRRRERAQRS